MLHTPAQSACRMNEGLGLVSKLGRSLRYSAGQSFENHHWEYEGNESQSAKGLLKG